MSKNLLDEKEKKKVKREPRNLLANKNPSTDMSELQLPGTAEQGMPINPAMSQQLEQPTQQVSEHPQIENFIKKFPQLAEYVGGLEWPKKEGVQKAANVAGKANKFIEDIGLPAFAGGGLQGLGNSAISAANLPLEMATGKRIPHLDLKKHLSEQNLTNDIAFGGGDIGGQILGFLLGSKGLGAGGKALGLTRPAGKAGLATDLAKEFGAGYLTGEDEIGEGRMTQGLLAGLLGAPLNLTTKNVVSRVHKGAQAAQKASSKLYNSIFEEAADLGLNKSFKAPKIDKKTLSRGLSSDYSTAVQDALSKPSLETFHKAQSDLGKFIRGTEEAIASGKASSVVIEAAKEAKIAQNKFLEQINKILTSADPGLAKQYAHATEHYAKNVVPYFDPHLIEYERLLKKWGATSGAKEAAKGLRNNKDFMAGLGKQYPELALNEYVPEIPTLAKYLGGGAAAGASLAGGYFGLDKLLNKYHKD